MLLQPGARAAAIALTAACATAVGLLLAFHSPESAAPLTAASAPTGTSPSTLAMLGSGLRTGLLPTPPIIFGTFVGYLGDGLPWPPIRWSACSSTRAGVGLGVHALGWM